jgi:hypothetical protein
VTCWRGQLVGRSWQQLLSGYGCHGLLLAGGVLLGKLVRWVEVRGQLVVLQTCPHQKGCARCRFMLPACRCLRSQAH